MSWTFWQTLSLLLSFTAWFYRGVAAAKTQSLAVADLLGSSCDSILTNQPGSPHWREAGAGWTCPSCCPVMKPTRLPAQQKGHWANVFDWRHCQHWAIWQKKNEDHWWAALQMEKLSIGIELNKYSSLSVSKMPPPAQPRKRRKPAWEPAHSLVWGCSRQEWSLIRCHFPYTGHHGKIKVTEINFVGLQKDEQNFPDPLMILQC